MDNNYDLFKGAPLVPHPEPPKYTYTSEVPIRSASEPKIETIQANRRREQKAFTYLERRLRRVLTKEERDLFYDKIEDKTGASWVAAVDYMFDNEMWLNSINMFKILLDKYRNHICELREQSWTKEKHHNEQAFNALRELIYNTQHNKSNEHLFEPSSSTKTMRANNRKDTPAVGGYF